MPGLENPAFIFFMWGQTKAATSRQGGEKMSVAKVIELVGESRKSWDDAVRNAVADAAKTVQNISGVEVYNMTANIENGQIVEYKANVKLAFGVIDR